MPFSWVKRHHWLFIYTFSVCGLFLAARGPVWITGDDIFIVSDRGQIVDEIVEQKGYLAAMQGRHYLMFGLRRLHDLLGSQKMLLLGLALQFFSGVLLCLVLRRFFSASAALFATVFFVTYLGKDEVIARLQGFQYHFVMFLGVLVLALLTSRRISPAWKAATSGAILWFSAHFCEILLMLIPWLMLLFWLETKSSGASLKKRLLLLLLIPFGFLVHIFLLFTAKGNLLWERGEQARSFSFLEATSKVKDVFIQGLDFVFGPEFWRIVDNGLRFFKNEILFAQPLVSSVILISVAGMLLFSWREQRSPPRFSPPILMTGFFVCLVLVLVGPMISFPIVAGVVPGRFSYVGSLGFAAAVAFLIDLSRFKKWLFRGFCGAIACYLLVSCLALAGRMKQHPIAGSFDAKVHQEVVSLLQREGRVVEHLALLFPGDGEILSYFQTVSPGYLDRDESLLLWAEFPDLVQPPKTIAALQGSHRFEHLYLPKIQEWKMKGMEVWELRFDESLRVSGLTKIAAEKE